MKFRDRIVLKDLVIPPEWVRIYAPRYGYVEYAMGENAPVHTIHFSECRIDRPTGMVDSKKVRIFERDVDSKGSVVTQAKSGEWMLIDKSGAAWPMIYLDPKKLTITGMVPWEEGR